MTPERWTESFYAHLERTIADFELWEQPPTTDPVSTARMMLASANNCFSPIRLEVGSNSGLLATRRNDGAAAGIRAALKLAETIGNKEELWRRLRGYVLADGSKSQDYNSGEISKWHYFQDPINPACLMRYKALRIMSLITGGAEPNHDALFDVVVDYVAYAVFLLSTFDVWSRRPIPGSDE